jgi:lipopolysaccharide export LptBFGC system permease protein LptF
MIKMFVFIGLVVAGFYFLFTYLNNNHKTVLQFIGQRFFKIILTIVAAVLFVSGFVILF